jgi:hypothetical protein
VITAHTLEVVCSCPADGTHDLYTVIIITRRVLAVEDILAAVAALPDVGYQEDITATLSRVLGTRVYSIGCHSGVTTRCWCP